MNTKENKQLDRRLPLRDEIEILVQQYLFFHQYSTIQVTRNRYVIISFSLSTTIAILAALGFSQHLSSLVLLVLFFLVTFFSIVSLFLYLGEEERMTRVGFYLEYLEKQINLLAGKNYYQWEQLIKKPRMKIVYPEYCILGLFIGVGFLSPIMGLLFLINRNPNISHLNDLATNNLEIFLGFSLSWELVAVLIVVFDVILYLIIVVTTILRGEFIKNYTDCNSDQISPLKHDMNLEIKKIPYCPCNKSFIERFFKL